MTDWFKRPGTAVHICYPSTKEGEMRRSLELAGHGSS